ncbi:BON domain-containing protein [Candidimonas sp. SYP-B2681]|uniref:BON domain-containing protein n=1 Tax=Candidimonas sp. SYP-B2681 TaxID=2497686 RepID=UPI003511AC77
MNEDTRFQRQQYRAQTAHRVYPKGYTRSDERIREDICERFSHSGLPVGDVSVEVAEGRVTLDGTVNARPVKHAIEDFVDDCMGVQEIDNRIKVQRPGQGGRDTMDSVSGKGAGGEGSDPETNTKPGE